MLQQQQLSMAFENKYKENIDESELYNKELVKLQDSLKKLQRRYALDDLEKELYLEFKAELEDKIRELEQKIKVSPINSSNLENYIEVSMSIARNLNEYWGSGDIDTKQRIQKLVFPEGMLIDPKNRGVLTKKVNTVFELIPQLAGASEEVIEKGHGKNPWPSSSVAGE